MKFASEECILESFGAIKQLSITPKFTIEQDLFATGCLKKTEC